MDTPLSSAPSAAPPPPPPPSSSSLSPRSKSRTCPECGYKFGSSANLERHRRIRREACNKRKKQNSREAAEGQEQRKSNNKEARDLPGQGAGSGSARAESKPSEEARTPVQFRPSKERQWSECEWECQFCGEENQTKRQRDIHLKVCPANTGSSSGDSSFSSLGEDPKAKVTSTPKLDSTAATNTTPGSNSSCSFVNVVDTSAENSRDSTTIDGFAAFDRNKLFQEEKGEGNDELGVFNKDNLFKDAYEFIQEDGFLLLHGDDEDDGANNEPNPALLDPFFTEDLESALDIRDLFFYRGPDARHKWEEEEEKPPKELTEKVEADSSMPETEVKAVSNGARDELAHSIKKETLECVTPLKAESEPSTIEVKQEDESLVEDELLCHEIVESPSSPPAATPKKAEDIASGDLVGATTRSAVASGKRPVFTAGQKKILPDSVCVAMTTVDLIVAEALGQIIDREEERRVKERKSKKQTYEMIRVDYGKAEEKASILVTSSKKEATASPAPLSATKNPTKEALGPPTVSVKVEGSSPTSSPARKRLRSNTVAKKASPPPPPVKKESSSSSDRKRRSPSPSTSSSSRHRSSPTKSRKKSKRFECVECNREFPSAFYEKKHQRKDHGAGSNRSKSRSGDGSRASSRRSPTPERRRSSRDTTKKREQHSRSRSETAPRREAERSSGGRRSSEDFTPRGVGGRLLRGATSRHEDKREPKRESRRRR